MQAALRRYVPGAVVDELDTKREIRSAECHVSVLFVDIRGYTSYSESRGPEEVFSIPELPRTATGKVEKFRLRQSLEEKGA